MNTQPTIAEAEAAHEFAVAGQTRAKAERKAIVDRRAVTTEKLEQIEDAMKPIAFDASKGKPEATSKLRSLRHDKAKLEGEAADQASALVEADRLLAEADADVSDAADRLTLAVAVQLGEQFVAQSVRIDQALAEIVDAVESRQQIYRQLARSTCLADPARLVSATRLAVAVRAAGAQSIFRHLSYTVSGDKSLAEMDRNTLLALELPRTRAPFSPVLGPAPQRRRSA